MGLAPAIQHHFYFHIHQNTLHCVLDGRKDFIIYDVSTQYPHEFDLVKQKNGDLYSRIDIDLVNAYKYKLLHDLPWYWTTLRESDCLFIPAHTFYQVRAHGRTIALAIDMAPPDIRDDFVGDDCEKNPPVYVSLNKGQFSMAIRTKNHSKIASLNTLNR